jgi:hypothetical protein
LVLGALEKIQLPFDVQPTVDIDIAYRFKGRSLARTLLSTFRFPLHLPHRIWSYLSRKDPFDPNNTVSKYLKGQEKQSRVFWLCSYKTNGANRQVQRKYPPFQSVIRSLEQTNEYWPTPFTLYITDNRLERRKRMVRKNHSI